MVQRGYRNIAIQPAQGPPGIFRNRFVLEALNAHTLNAHRCAGPCLLLSRGNPTLLAYLTRGDCGFALNSTGEIQLIVGTKGAQRAGERQPAFVGILRLLSSGSPPAGCRIWRKMVRSGYRLSAVTPASADRSGCAHAASELSPLLSMKPNGCLPRTLGGAAISGLFLLAVV